VIRDVNPDVIVNAAAYTQVDKAESEPARAFAVNADAPGRIGETARSIGAKMIHISTDYVFDGEKPTAYDETDTTNPRNIYGKSKLAGEIAVRAAGVQHLILRTAWVYSPFGINFVSTMMRLARERERLGVVEDQVGSPTCALDLADAIFAVLGAWQEGKTADLGGTYNCAGSGLTSWCGLAEQVFATSRKLGGPSAMVDPITTAQWPTIARRPGNSVLDSRRFSSQFGFQMPDWRLSAAQIVRRILDNDE
jgi:dTDP-4-dehydrorhamnose reductase